MNIAFDSNMKLQKCKLFGNIAMNIVTGYNKGQNIDKYNANKQQKNDSKTKKENIKEAGGGQRQERPAAERKKTRETLL